MTQAKLFVKSGEDWVPATDAMLGGSGGGGTTGGALEATQLAVKAAVEGTDAKMLTLLSQTDGLENAMSATAARLPATLGSKTGATSLSVVPAAGTLTNRSGAITTGGTAQVLMASNANRIGFSVQNLSTGDLWINPLGTASAAQPSIKLAPGVYFESPVGYGSVLSVSIFGATTGQSFSALEW